ncbi:MAG: VOC family protein [Actinomycetota bacterium]|nr:VOC family protein [Actinomycetota bacterium]
MSEESVLRASAAAHPSALDFSVAAINHIGVTVEDLEAAMAFWTGFLQVDPLWHLYLDAPYLSSITGYPKLAIEACMIPLPGGVFLELLEYQTSGKASNDMGTANPGNVHICFEVSDVDAAWSRAVALGARSRSPETGTISSGPNMGNRACYLRIHDDVTIEIVTRKN